MRSARRTRIVTAVAAVAALAVPSIALAGSGSSSNPAHAASAAGPTATPVSRAARVANVLHAAKAQLHQVGVLLGRAKSEHGASLATTAGQLEALIADVEAELRAVQPLVVGNAAVAPKVDELVGKLGRLQSAISGVNGQRLGQAATAPSPVSASPERPATTITTSQPCSSGQPYQPTASDKSNATAVLTKLQSRLDLSHAKPAVAAISPLTGGASAFSVLLTAPCYVVPNVAVGTPASVALSRVPAALMARAHSNTFISTAGMTPAQLNVLRSQIARENYQTSVDSSSSYTVMGSPGYSWYFGQIYGQYTSDGNTRLVGCNMEMFGDTPYPTRGIQYGLDMSCSDAKMWWGQILDLGDVETGGPLGVQDVGLQWADPQFYSGNTGNHWEIWDYWRTSETQLENMYDFFGVDIVGWKGADGWYGPPPTTGESVSCYDSNYNPNGEIGSLSIYCEIESKAFTTIGGAPEYTTYLESAAIAEADTLDNQALALLSSVEQQLPSSASVGFDIAGFGNGPVAGALTTDYAQATASALAQKPSERPAYIAALRGLLSELRAGQPVVVPGTGSRAEAESQLTRALATAELTSFSTSSSLTEDVTQPSASDPRKFRIGGNVQKGDNHFWTNMDLWIAHVQFEVDSQGNTEARLTDKVLAHNITFSPGAVTSRVDFNFIYFPQSDPPYFSNIHMQLWVLCYRTLRICNSDTYNESTTPAYTSSSIAMYGHVISLPAKLWGRNRNSTGYDGSPGRTGFATCNTGDARCRFLRGGA